MIDLHCDTASRLYYEGGKLSRNKFSIDIKKLKECNLDVLKTATSTVNNQVKKILAKEQIRKPIKKVEVKKEETIEQK